MQTPELARHAIGRRVRSLAYASARYQTRELPPQSSASLILVPGKLRRPRLRILRTARRSARECTESGTCSSKVWPQGITSGDDFAR